MALDTTFLNNVTRTFFIPGLKNQIYDKIPLFNRLLAKGRGRRAVGRSLIFDAVLTKHSAFGLYSGYDVLASQPVNPVQQGSLSWSDYYATLSISNVEVWRNSGNKEKLLDMIRVQTENALRTLKERMQQDLYNTGGTVGGNQRLEGLRSVVGTGRTYAGINSSTFSNWDSNVNSTTHSDANLRDPTSTSYLPRILRNSYTSATHDDAPDFAITTKLIYNAYQDIAGVQNLQIDEDVADLGFGGVKFQGGVSILFDDYINANYFYFLNLSNFQAFVFPQANFDFDGWQRPVNQNARITHVFW
ncbi:MAG: phage major capsid protein, partial [Bacteroidota bacterium]